MNNANLIDMDYVRSVLRWDKETGEVFWREDVKRKGVTPGRKVAYQCGTMGHIAVSLIVPGKGRRPVRLHCILWRWANGDRKIPDGFDVDHKDGKPRNNKEGNHRLATRSQNNGNSKSRGGSSKFKGVSFCRRRKKWTAQIAGSYIGRFHSEDEAARAYDDEAMKKWGDFAHLNFPEVT